MSIDSASLRSLERLVVDAVVSSADPLLQHWQKQKAVKYKEKSDPVTEFDVKIEEGLRLKLAKLLPEAGFIVEEGETSRSAECNWVIDPIDQTKNFVGQIPLFYTQVALIKDGQPLLGVIYNPVSGQLFSASSGNGARLNQKQVNLKPKDRLDRMIIDVDFGDNSDLAWKLRAVEALAGAAFRLRVSGGAYAVHLLTGGVDAFVVVNQKTKLVDQMPRMVLAREAGLTFEEYIIADRKILIAAPHAASGEILRLLEGLLLD